MSPPPHHMAVESSASPPQQWMHPNGKVETGLLGPDQSQATLGSAPGTEHQGSELFLGFPPYRGFWSRGKGREESGESKQKMGDAGRFCRHWTEGLCSTCAIVQMGVRVRLGYGHWLKKLELKLVCHSWLCCSHPACRSPLKLQGQAETRV